MKVHFFYAKIDTRFKSDTGVPLDLRMRQSTELKVAFIGTLLKTAYETFQGTSEPGDIFVFIAPEYLFVNYDAANPKNRASFFLTAAQKTDLIQRLTALCKPSFDNNPNVLIILGTIGHYVDAGSLTAAEIQGITHRCQNISLVGDDDTKAQRKDLLEYYTKDGQSGKALLDRLNDANGRAGLFVVRNTAVIYCNTAVQTYDKRYEAMLGKGLTGELPSYNGWENWLFAPGINAPWVVTLNTLKFGVEICAEFEYGNLRYDGNDGAGITDLDFQVIPAQEVSIDGAAYKYACKNTGFVVKCDSRDCTYANSDGKFPGEERLPDLVDINARLQSVVLPPN